MRWKNAVLEAVVNLTDKLNSPHFTRQQLLENGLEKLLENTQTVGATPSQTLSRELQQLRDRNILQFGKRGHYTFVLEPDLKNSEDLTLLELEGNAEEVGYTSVMVRRPRRDTALVLSLKKIYEYRCQFCNIRLELPRFYAEAHHVKPLGNPHSGPDNLANLLVVCPNHHALLDYGGIRIESEKIRLEHDLSPIFVAYHNEVIFGK
jgi:predicted HNH restriction endonuclease